MITPLAFVNLRSLPLITALDVLVNLNPVALLNPQGKVARWQMIKVVAPLERLVAATLLMATL